MCEYNLCVQEDVCVYNLCSIGYIQTLWHFIRDLTICEFCMGWRAHRNQTPSILRDDGAGKLASLGERANGKGAWTCPCSFHNEHSDFPWFPVTSDNCIWQPFLPRPTPSAPVPWQHCKMDSLSYKSSWNQPLYSEILRLKKCNFYYSQNSTEVSLVA